MTIPYNAEALTTVDYIKESFDREPNPDYNKEFSNLLQPERSSSSNSSTKLNESSHTPMDNKTPYGDKGKGKAKGNNKRKLALEELYYINRLKSDPFF